MTKCPCRNCTIKRQIGCHSKCNDYKEWREDLTATKQSAHDIELIEYILNSIERRRKAKNVRSGH